MRIVVAAVLFSLIAFVARAAGSAPLDTPTTPATYPIRLSTDEVGQRFVRTVDYTYTREWATRRDEKPHDDGEDEFSLHLEAEFEVLEARNGEATKLKLTVVKFEWKGAGGEPRALLNPGRQIVAEPGTNGHTVYSAPDGLLPRGVAEHLSQVVRLSGRNDSSADDVYGTRQPQPIGGAWPIHSQRFVRSMAQSGSIVDTGSLHGTMKLADVQRHTGVDCLLIESEIEFAMTVPRHESWRQTAGTVRHSSVSQLPVEPMAGETRWSSVTESNMRFVRNFGPRGARRESMVDKLVRMTEARTRPLPAGPMTAATKPATLPVTLPVTLPATGE